MYILYDEFHKVNSKRESEVLRHTSLVENLQRLNTQSCEQLNCSIGRKNYFLDRMSPLHHLFYLRLIIELSNKSKNFEMTMMKQRRFEGVCLKEDSFGRLFHATTARTKEEVLSLEYETSEDEMEENSSAASIVADHLQMSSINSQQSRLPNNCSESTISCNSTGFLDGEINSSSKSLDCVRPN